MNMQRTSTRRGSLNRRDFLKSAVAIGAAGAAVMAAPRILHAAHKGNAIRLALIGCGTEGYVLSTSVLKSMKTENVTFRAVCDIWPRNLNHVGNMLGKFQARPNVYADCGDMLDREKGNLDAVIVATPDWVHHEHSIACMEAGLDVYCEKEMSNSIENARKMVEAARKTGRLLQIGHQRRSNPRYQALYDHIVNKNACGRITQVSANWNRDKPLTVKWSAVHNMDPDRLRRYGYESMQHLCNWRWYRRYSGGPMADLGSHQVDVLNWILGRPPRSVMASGGADNFPHMEWWDNIIALYEWDREADGRPYTVRGNYDLYSTTSHGGYQEVFMGTQATAIISEDTTKGGFWHEMTAEESEWEKKHATGPCERIIAVGPSFSARRYPPIPVPKNPKTEHQPHLENFFHAIRGAEKLTCPAEVGFETAVTVLKVDQAIKAERKLPFRPEEFKA